MRGVAIALSVVLGALATTASAQEATKKDKRVRPAQAGNSDVHRMEIYNGAARVVRYFGQSVSPGEESALRDLERAENDIIYARGLQALKSEYVSDERLMEAHRWDQQQKLYARYITRTSTGTAGAFGSGYPYGYGTATNPGFPGGGPLLGYNAFGALGGYGGGYGYGGGASASASSNLTVARSLNYGVGDEGRLKTALSQAIAVQSTPEYMKAADRALDRATARAASSPAIRVALRLPDSTRNPLAFAAGEAAPVTVFFKTGEPVVGRQVEEGPNWIVITTLDGRKVRVRPSEVIRIDEGKDGAVRPAVGR